MSRYRYDLHRYGTGVDVFESFPSRRALSDYMRRLPESAVELADHYFLLARTPSCLAVYNFVASSDGLHLKAVISRKTSRLPLSMRGSK